MSIYSIAGQIGAGKSHFQLKYALELAELKEKQLVCNFPLDRKALKIYAEFNKLKWILQLLEYGGITEYHAPKNLRALLLPQSIVCLDEAGILLNSRCWKDTPRELLADLCQSRKTGTDLIWAAQFPEQIDSQIRSLTQYWIYANGLTYYDKISKMPRLYYKRYYFMDSEQFSKWNNKGLGHFKTRFGCCYRYHGGFLNHSDRLLFDCFDTATRLDISTGGYSKFESLNYSRLCDRPAFHQFNYEQRHDLLISSDHQSFGTILKSKIPSSILIDSDFEDIIKKQI